MMAMKQSERLAWEKFRRQQKNLFKKAKELAQMTDSKVYLSVERNDKYHTYKSTEKLNWPSERETVSYA